MTMGSKWVAAFLVAGALFSMLAGVWVTWKWGPAVQRLKRRVGRERVSLALFSRLKSEEMMGLRLIVLSSILIYVGTYALTGRTLLAVTVALGGLMVPGWVREWLNVRRLTLLADQLGRVMGMVSTSLRRGTPLEIALSEAALAMAYPLGPVLRNLADATKFGVTLGQAAEQVRALPAVTGSTDFQVFATEVVICHERGANVVTAFDALRQVLTARRRYRDLVVEQMGQHLIQALVIAGIGLVVLLVYALMTPDGLGPLLDSAFGQTVLAISILGNVFLIRLTHMGMLKQIRRV